MHHLQSDAMGEETNTRASALQSACMGLFFLLLIVAIVHELAFRDASISAAPSRTEQRIGDPRDTAAPVFHSNAQTP